MIATLLLYLRLGAVAALTGWLMSQWMEPTVPIELVACIVMFLIAIYSTKSLRWLFWRVLIIVLAFLGGWWWQWYFMINLSGTAYIAVMITVLAILGTEGVERWIWQHSPGSLTPKYKDRRIEPQSVLERGLPCSLEEAFNSVTHDQFPPGSQLAEVHRKGATLGATLMLAALASRIKAARNASHADEEFDRLASEPLLRGQFTDIYNRAFFSELASRSLVEGVATRWQRDLRLLLLGAAVATVVVDPGWSGYKTATIVGLVVCLLISWIIDIWPIEEALGRELQLRRAERNAPKRFDHERNA